VDEGAPEATNVSVSGGPVSLNDGYQRAIRQVESLAENQTGSEKTWVERPRTASFSPATRKTLRALMQEE
jgi:hypothetical protein